MKSMLFTSTIILMIILAFIFTARCKNKSLENNSNTKISNIKQNSNSDMTLTSDNFNNDDFLPVKYTCKGEGVSPELSWYDFPKETKSFALIMEDPDTSSTYVHWLAYNIPVKTIPINIESIPENSREVPNAINVVNDSGKNQYSPPCPPEGIHYYNFKIFALDIDKLDNVNKSNFYAKISPHIIDQAVLSSKFQIEMNY